MGGGRRRRRRNRRRRAQKVHTYTDACAHACPSAKEGVNVLQHEHEHEHEHEHYHSRAHNQFSMLLVHQLTLLR